MRRHSTHSHRQPSLTGKLASSGLDPLAVGEVGVGDMLDGTSQSRIELRKRMEID